MCVCVCGAARPHSWGPARRPRSPAAGGAPSPPPPPPPHSHPRALPAVPRHNLKHVRALLEPLCRKHGIPYRSTGLFEGTGEILAHLQEISLELSKGPM